MNQRLMDAIKRYGGEPVTDIAALENRRNKIAEDRDCWLANARANQAEYQKLEVKLKAGA